MFDFRGLPEPLDHVGLKDQVAPMVSMVPMVMTAL